MNRVFIAVLITAGFFLYAHRPASAMVEFCPATLAYARVGPDSQSHNPGQLYGFDLTALSPRTISSARLAFDTSGGWYTVDLPPMTLAEKDRHLSASWVSFTHRDFVTPVSYVRFPQPVTIAHAWVSQAAAQNDGGFGWQALGSVLCDPPAADSPAQAKLSDQRQWNSPYKLDPKDDDRLSSPPPKSAFLFAATAVKALETTDCAEPFRQAEAKHIAQPTFPESMRYAAATRSTTSVEVAIEANGTLQDAWVWGPSGAQAFDDESLRAARESTYTGARAYCRAVPGRYFFRVTFAPNG